MADTHHDRTKVPPRDAPGRGAGRDASEGEGDAQLTPSPPNVGDGPEPPASDGEEDGNGVARAGDVQRLQDEVTSLNDRLLRLAAEFDNYRRRTERERGDMPQRARAEVVGRLLDVMDDLQRVAAFDDATSAHALLEGVRLVEKKMRRVVEGWGVEAVDPSGDAFDPETMEAMATVPAERPEEDDVVADVFQKGYRLGDMLIRPARVRVRKFEG